MRNHLILIGPPGAGKGTLSANLKDYTHISTGDIIRSEISKGTPLGLSVKDLISKGELLSDDIVIKLVDSTIESSRNYLFDGFPRSTAQAEYLIDKLKEDTLKAVLMNIDYSDIKDRVCNRLISPCGKYIYNSKLKPPRQAGICDITGEELISRPEDNEESLSKRLEEYESTTKPIVELFRSRGLLMEINSKDSIDSNIEKIKDKS